MKRERIFYLDFVRAVATISIIFTHYNALFIYNTSIPMPQKAILTMTVGNVYIGSWGVSLFLIISGADVGGVLPLYGRYGCGARCFATDGSLLQLRSFASRPGHALTY